MQTAPLLLAASFAILAPLSASRATLKHCGNRRYELVCENNDTSIYLDSHKFYVKAINYSTFTVHNKLYDNSTIRLVDASVNNDDTCSFPNYSLLYSDFVSFKLLYRPTDSFSPINLLSCPHQLKNSSLFTEITHCAISKSNSSHPRFSYVKVGHMNASEVPESCRIDLIFMTSWREFKDVKNVSLDEIHRSLLYGFEVLVYPYYEISWIWWAVYLTPVVLVVFISAVLGFPLMIILGLAAGLVLTLTGIGSLIFIFAPRFIICPFAIGLLIYKFRRRHLSMYEGIESFLRSDNKLKPIQYSYSDVKKMTKGFHDKLGKGGYGSVYKGKLRSGHHVAVKLLEKSKANGQDFINEISTIGRIHHVNIVKLVGYCAEGSKRALVFDFMLNGSLEKYISNREKLNSLSWVTKFDIAVGVARGIEYLHVGCNIQILHFDIKPHNILLDDNFIPKISDFGLAKICSANKNAITITNPRGTIGYIAPELMNRSLGRVSYKADVYSFGMLLMEMVGLKRDLIGNNDSSTKYFPCWIYECFEQGNNIEIGKEDENGDASYDDHTRRLVRKMTIVALWCIQMSPDDRPSMNNVLKMLEGDVACLQLPEYTSQSAEILENEYQAGITCSTDSVSLLHHDSALPHVEITVRE